jgi:hypothetical protein
MSWKRGNLLSQEGKGFFPAFKSYKESIYQETPYAL